MTAVAPSFPSGREIAGLWRQVNAPGTADCWIGHLLLHRIEAPVLLDTPAARLPLELATLRALAASQPAETAQLEQRLALGHALARRVLASLHKDNLILAAGGDSWRLSATGTRLVTGLSTPTEAVSRSVFYFLQHPDGKVAYVHLRRPGTPLPATPPNWNFTPQHLVECTLRSSEWKQTHHFPKAVVRILTLHSDLTQLAPDLQAWELVILDQAETLTLLIVAEPHLLRGYALEPGTWNLVSAEPALILGPDSAIAEVLGDMMREPEMETWHAAWKEWCATHGIPLAEAAAIGLVHRGAALQVTGHPIRPERLRSLAGDAAHAEPWLLAGAGPFRCAARIEFAAARS